jgi:hypothetical protein
MEYMLVRADFPFHLCRTLKTPYDHQQPQVISFPVIMSTPVASQDLPAIHDLKNGGFLLVHVKMIF